MKYFHRYILRTGGPLFLAVLFASLGQAQLVTDNFQGSEVVANEVLVKFKQPAASDSLAQANLAVSIDEAKTVVDVDSSRTVGSAGWMLFHSISQNVASLVGALSTLPEVDRVQPNFIYHPDAAPNDPDFSDQWGFNNAGQAIYLDNSTWRSGTPGADIGAVNAWNISTGTSTILVGVIDSGIDYNHADLSTNVWSAPYRYAFQLGNSLITCPAGSHGWNAVNNTCDPIYDYYHGTFISGLIGATGNNALGVAGVNWSTKILSCEFADSQGNGTSDRAIVTCPPGSARNGI